MFSLTQNYLTRGFWGDEAWTSLISQLPYLQMLSTTARDFHPPAYYTVVELWYKIFPTTEVSTRIVSVIFYFLTVFLVYKLAYYISILRESPSTSLGTSEPTLEVIGRGRFWGLISALVVALNPIFFTYAFEARNYTMFAFAATGSMYFLLRLLKNSTSEESEPTSEVKAQQHPENRLPRPSMNSGLAMTRDHVAFILFSTLGIYTHYYMFFTLFAQGLFVMLFERKILLKMLGLYAIVGVLYLPWIPLLASQVSTVAQSYWIGSIDGRTHFEALLRILGGEHQNIFRPVLFGLFLTLIGIGLTGHIRQKTFEKPYILIWLWAVVPFILATLPGLKVAGVHLPFRPVFFWRYLIPAAVPLSMVIVHAAEKLPNVFFKFSIALVILLSLIINYLTFLRYPRTFKQVYENEIVAKIKPEDKIVTVLPSFGEVLYYRNRFGLANEMIVLPEGLIQHSGKSLLDAYVENGVVAIEDYPEGVYWELRPGPSIVKVESQSVK